jgi:hypothetical protein
MAKFPEGVAGYNISEPNKPLELTDIAYNHRSKNLRQSEEDYQDEHGEPFQCPTCRKHTYTYVEGGEDSPDCDSCWKSGEDIGLPLTKWSTDIPRVSDVDPSKNREDNLTPMTVRQYSDHNWKSIIGESSDEFPKGPYSCHEPDPFKMSVCRRKFNTIESLTDHWTNDPEHHDAWGKD